MIPNGIMRRGQTASDMLGDLQEVFGDTVSGPGLDIWFEAFSDFSIDQFAAAAKSVMATRVYKGMPTIAELRNAASGQVEDIAQVEAGKVLSAISSVGAYNSVAFDNPTTTAVIRQIYGGWVKLCQELTEEKKSVFIGQFRKAFVAYARQGISERGHMAGIVEGENRAAGYLEHVPPPVIIGDKRAALRLAAPSRDVEAEAAPEVMRLVAGIGG
jgi:hypothetical protein